MCWVMLRRWGCFASYCPSFSYSGFCGGPRYYLVCLGRVALFGSFDAGSSRTFVTGSLYRRTPLNSQALQLFLDGSQSLSCIRSKGVQLYFRVRLLTDHLGSHP